MTMMMWGHGFGWFGWLFMMGFWVLLVVGIVWLVRSFADRDDPAVSSNARRILDERFASGELSADEYQERRRVLS
jgi:putative membrane protein